ncbi:MAG: chromate transporter, partial [Cyanobacteria bacterium]|nr:chromate transporter [Cyanobacteriota bacterium]
SVTKPSTESDQAYGERLAGWRGTALALSAGAAIPAAIVGLIAAAYVSTAGHPLVERAMQGARAGALAVLLWAALRLLKPQLAQTRARGVAFSAAALLLALVARASPLVVLLIAGGLGAISLRHTE